MPTWHSDIVSVTVVCLTKSLCTAIIVNIISDFGHLQLLCRLHLLLLLGGAAAGLLLKFGDLGLALLHQIHLLLPFVHVGKFLTLAHGLHVARSLLSLVLQVDSAIVSIILELFEVALITVTGILRLSYLIRLLLLVNYIILGLLRSFHGRLRNRELLSKIIS